MKNILTWPNDPTHPVKKRWKPWWVIAWRAIWLIPLMAVLIAEVVITFIGWGPDKACQRAEDISDNNL